jgi:hypothetical protein
MRPRLLLALVLALVVIAHSIVFSLRCEDGGKSFFLGDVVHLAGCPR